MSVDEQTAAELAALKAELAQLRERLDAAPEAIALRVLGAIGSSLREAGWQALTPEEQAAKRGTGTALGPTSDPAQLALAAGSLMRRAAYAARTERADEVTGRFARLASGDVEVDGSARLTRAAQVWLWRTLLAAGGLLGGWFAKHFWSH